MTDRPDDKDNEGRNVNNVTNVDDEAQTPLNLDENFSTYATTSSIINPEQNVARMMPIKTSYKPEPSIAD
jgi:hypothetical protein